MGRYRSITGALQVIFQIEQTRTWKIKDLVMLAYSDLDNNKEMEQKSIATKSSEMNMKLSNHKPKHATKTDIKFGN